MKISNSSKIAQICNVVEVNESVPNETESGYKKKIYIIFAQSFIEGYLLKRFIGATLSATK